MIYDKRIRIIIGHYGSGKTEFSINYAIALARQGRKVALADLDFVNTYFRSREKYKLLESHNILMVSSYIKDSGIDLPSISANILEPLQNENYDLIMDVGGDSAGTRALGRYHDYLIPGKYDMFFVVNTNRPETRTVAGVMYHIESIEKTARAKITGLISNTHLLGQTTVDDVMKGLNLCRIVSDELNIPIKYISTIESVARELPDNLESRIMPVKMIMREDWM